MKPRTSPVTLPGFLPVLAVLALPAAGTEGPTLAGCAVCHDEEVRVFTSGPHGRAMAARSAELLERSCGACHAPEAGHADAPSTANVSRTPKAGACDTCHAPRRPGRAAGTAGVWSRGDHERHGLTCLTCHASGHGKPAAAPLLSASQGSLCGGCHAGPARGLRQPSAHRTGSRPFDCATCHSVHGGPAGGLFPETGTASCASCHSERTGPFVYPHAASETGGCVACHTPHGSQNPRMLKRRRISDLCLECHTGTPPSHDPSSSRYRSCHSCHVAVHGSQRDPRLLEE